MLRKANEAITETPLQACRHRRYIRFKSYPGIASNRRKTRRSLRDRMKCKSDQSPIGHGFRNCGF